MHPIDPLRGFITRLLPVRLLRKFRRDERSTPSTRTPSPEQGEGRPLSALVQPGSSVLHVGGSIPTHLADAVPMQSRLRAVPIGVSLDVVLESGGPPVNLINCEEPSHVLRTLRGAGNLLVQTRPAWRMQIIGDPDDHAGAAHAVFHLLARRGYAAFVWDHDKLRPRRFDDAGPWYYFLTNRHIQSLPGDLIGSGTEPGACRAA